MSLPSLCLRKTEDQKSKYVGKRWTCPRLRYAISRYIILPFSRRIVFQDKAEKLFKEVSARTRTGQKHTIGENLAAVRLPSPHPDSRRSKVPKNSFNPQDPLTTSALPSTDRTFLHSGHFPKSQSFSSLRIDSPSTSLAGTSKIDDGAAIEASFSSDFLPSNGHLTPVNPRRHGRGKSLGSCDSRRRAIYDSTVQISDPLYSGNIPSQWITFDSFTSLGQAQAESSPIRTAHSILPAAFDRSDTISSPQHSFHTTSSPFDTSLGNPGAHGHAGYSRSPANFLHLTKGQIKGKRRSVPVGMHVADSGGGTVPNVPAIPAIYLPSNATESVPECRVPLAEHCHHPIVKQLMLDLDRAIEEWDMISLTI